MSNLQDIKEGGQLFSLPMDICLVHKSTEEAFNKGLGEGLDEFTAMAAKLMRERSQQQESIHYHYIQVLILHQSACILDCCTTVRHC